MKILRIHGTLFTRTMILTGFALIAASGAAVAAGPAYRSHYAGEEKRRIKSLSPEDIQELSEGGGWGLAKAAELNGLPGPKHILEMKEEIGLTTEQEVRVERLYREMHEEAVALGAELIELERELNDRFARGDIDKKILDDLLLKISLIQRSLRFTHLSAHLSTPDILTEAQIEKYNELRGYFTLDPCENIPEGHDPVMWRTHNNCDS